MRCHPWRHAKIFSAPLKAAALLLVVSFVLTSTNRLTAQQPAKESLPVVGDSPSEPGPLATGLSPQLKRRDVAQALRKVADWQLNRVQGQYTQDWTLAALYAGFVAVPPEVHGNTYRDAMKQMGTQFRWQLGPRAEHADDQAIAQTYLALYESERDPAMLTPTRADIDAMLQRTDDPSKPLWWWCDALFMAPPVWSRMFAATHDTKYLDYLDKHWWETSNLLYDPQRHLYFRDITFLHKTDDRGNPIFWSRGNGWVMGGIARTLDYMPEDYPTRGKYEAQLREMAEAVTKLQDAHSGLWHSNLLDPVDYPQPETSGSALITFALAWGINHGVLDRATYMPVIAKAWRGLVGEIFADGRLGNIQQTGSAPAYYLPSSSYTYGIGGFLLAGSEVAQLSTHSGKHKGKSSR